jgi:hypothetical protein
MNPRRGTSSTSMTLGLLQEKMPRPPGENNWAIPGPADCLGDGVTAPARS